MIGLNRRRMMGNALPYDAEIEYLESNGNQWIDTSIFANGEFEFEFAIMVTQWTTNAVYAGARSSSQFLTILQQSGTATTAYGYLGNYYSLNETFNLNNKYSYHIIYKNNLQEIYINGIRKIYRTDNGAESLNLPIYLYKRSHYSTDTVNGLYGRFYYFKIIQNDVLVRDYIPVRVGQVGYMYDKVSGQLFGNAGSGSFILGNDK